MMLLAFLLALPASFNGSTWQDAGVCDSADSTYSMCARLTNLSTPGASSFVAYAAASSVYSDVYVYVGLNNNLLPECTYRDSSRTFSVKGSQALDSQGTAEHVIYCVADGAGATLKIYVNGVERGSLAMVGAQPPKTLCTWGALRRGATPTIGNFWKGQILDARFFDRALSATEVATGRCGAEGTPGLLACHGHTGLTWNSYSDSSVTHFEVERAIHGLGNWSSAGDTAYKNRPAYTDEEGVEIPAARPELWDLLRAWSLPVADVEYDYRVIAVSPTGRSSPSNVVSCGPQDPTRCYPEACP